MNADQKEKSGEGEAVEKADGVGVLNYGVERKQPLVMTAGCALLTVMAVMAMAAMVVAAIGIGLRGG